LVTAANEALQEFASFRARQILGKFIAITK
jgi:hypothetical protein